MRIIFSCIVWLMLAQSIAAQEFDERKSDWPANCTITGTVMIGGGDRVSDDVIERFVRKSRDQQIVLLDLSADGMSDSQKEALDPAHTMRIPGKRSAKKESIESQCKKIRKMFADESTDSDGDFSIWIHADHRLHHNQRAVLLTIKPEILNATRMGGTVFASQSIASSLGQFEIVGGQFFGDPSVPLIVSGLGVLPDTVVETDYQKDNRTRLLAVLAAHPRCIGIGIENDALIELNGRKVMVIGDGSATAVLMANERLPIQTKSLAGVDPTKRINPYRSMIDLTAWRRQAIDRTLEPFPAEQPRTPHVENGTLFIIGGGGTPRGLMDQFVKAAGGDEAKLVYVPCLESESTSRRDQRLIRQWNQMGVQSASILHTKDRAKADSDEEFLAPLKDATGIWFGGGRQWNFSDSYYGTRAHRLMKEVLQRGGAIGGSSAGASIQARYLARANPLGNFDIMAAGYERGGLGFISGIAIDQHFSQRGRQKDMTQLVDRYPQILGVGIDESTALIVRKSVGEIVGRGKVFFYKRKQQVVDGEDDFIALEAGQKFDLAKRVLIKDDSAEE